MDEPVLRALIQKLTKRLLPEFEKVSDADDRMSLGSEFLLFSDQFRTGLIDLLSMPPALKAAFRIVNS